MILNEERTHGFNIDLKNYDSHFPYFEFTQSEQRCDKFATVHSIQQGCQTQGPLDCEVG